MKIHILFELKNHAWGGANQFLKSLKKEFQINGAYSEEIAAADIILFNSHHNTPELLAAKKTYPSKIFAHRVDGPVRLYNDPSDGRDEIVYGLNNEIADATIFQSYWSMKKNFEMGMMDNKPKAVILNASDPETFSPPAQYKKNDKTRIISTSFSPNMKKGFRLYEFLDKKLDFSRYEYTFAGANPVKFENINHVGILSSHELSEKLRRSDIFITASENDPCSNSLIEAANSGLICFALNSGGHGEILNDDALLFDNVEQLLSMIESAALDIELAKKPSINRNASDAAKEYMIFFSELFSKKSN